MCVSASLEQLYCAPVVKAAGQWVNSYIITNRNAHTFDNWYRQLLVSDRATSRQDRVNAGSPQGRYAICLHSCHTAATLMITTQLFACIAGSGVCLEHTPIIILTLESC